MEFYYNDRLGWKTKLPKLYGRAKPSAKTIYDASFAVIGAKLWNLLPKDVTTHITLDNFKIHLGKFISNIPDNLQLQNYKQ